MARSKKRKAKDKAYTSPSSKLTRRVDAQDKAGGNPPIASLASIGEEEDIGITESQQFLAASKALTKSRKNNTFPHDFKKRVKTDQAELNALLDEQETSSAEADRKFRDVMRHHLAALFPPPESDIGSGKPFLPAHALLYYRSAERMVQHSHALLGQYNRISRIWVDSGVLERCEGLQKGWEVDRAEAARLLGAGKKVAEQKAERVTKAHTVQVGWQQEAGTEKGEEERRQIAAAFPALDKRGEDRALKHAVKRAGKGIEKMLKGLPSEEA